MPVGGDVFDRFVRRAEDVARKGAIMSAASVRGNVVLRPCEVKPDETSGDRFVVEWTGNEGYGA